MKAAYSSQCDIESAHNNISPVSEIEKCYKVSIKQKQCPYSIT